MNSFFSKKKIYNNKVFKHRKKYIYMSIKNIYKKSRTKKYYIQKYSVFKFAKKT